MTPETVRVPAFAVIGLTTRTSNQRETAGESRIGPLWQKFLQGGGIPIPGVLDETTIYSVYTSYESDHTGAYDVILGKSVSDSRKAPEGMRGIEVPAAEYLVFPAANDTAQAIKTAWQLMYSYFSGPSETRRAFTIDFDRYSPEGVHIYVAVLRRQR